MQAALCFGQQQIVAECAGNSRNAISNFCQLKEISNV